VHSRGSLEGVQVLKVQELCEARRRDGARGDLSRSTETPSKGISPVAVMPRRVCELGLPNLSQPKQPGLPDADEDGRLDSLRQAD